MQIAEFGLLAFSPRIFFVPVGRFSLLCFISYRRVSSELGHAPSSVREEATKKQTVKQKNGCGYPQTLAKPVRLLSRTPVRKICYFFVSFLDLCLSIDFVFLFCLCMRMLLSLSFFLLFSRRRRLMPPSQSVCV